MMDGCVTSACQAAEAPRALVGRRAAAGGKMDGGPWLWDADPTALVDCGVDLEITESCMVHRAVTAAVTEVANRPHTFRRFCSAITK